MIQLIDTNEVYEPLELRNSYFLGTGNRSTLMIDRLLNKVDRSYFFYIMDQYKCQGFPSLLPSINPEEYFDFFWTFYHNSDFINFVDSSDLWKELKGKKALVFVGLKKDDDEKRLTMEQVMNKSIERSGAVALTVINHSIY